MIKVDYEEALRNNLRTDAPEAAQRFLSGEDGTVFTLFPQALNPFLRSLESLQLWKKALVLPYADSNNRPLYIIMRVDGAMNLKGVEV